MFVVLFDRTGPGGKYLFKMFNLWTHFDLAFASVSRQSFSCLCLFSTNASVVLRVRCWMSPKTLRGLTISSSMDAAISLWISAVCSKSFAMKCQALLTVPTFSLLALKK